jgi:hypothetical protein
MVLEALQQFHREFFQEVLREADAGGRFAEDAFFELFCSQLVEEGELETADRARYVSPRGLRIDGYGGDPAYAEGTLSLIVADFSQSGEVQTLTATEMEASFKRASTFLRRSLERDFRSSLEETSAGFGLATLIADSWRIVSKVRILLITNRLLSRRVDGREVGELEGRPVVYSVWDLERLHRYATSSRSREDTLVELQDHGGYVPALEAHLTGADYQGYLLVLSGGQLASIYGRLGARLLEQNVRVFLQARGKVNKGIRNTIENDPEMFFAYNNGITATAEEVFARSGSGPLMITGFRNLQIVNGGQTTASIYAASRKKDIDLTKVFVQMKVSVIPAGRTEEVVPRISEYANSQNKVNAADFFANHPFHLRFKEFSETVFAPSRDGTFRESKWFYERARGQYQEARGNLSGAALKRFDLEYPKRQVVVKTDLAKYLLVWRQLPHIVSMGAQKNFSHFAEMVGREWAERSDRFNEVFFRQSIAKAIVFREAESLVSSQPWYEGGYRANIVAYTLSKLAADIERNGGGVDFDMIWKHQAVPEQLRAALVVGAEQVREVIVNPPPGAVTNVTEWAKREACWTKVQALAIRWPAELVGVLVTGEEQQSITRQGIREQRVLNGIEAQVAVVNAGPELWARVRRWASEHRALSQKELEILDVAAAMPKKLPTEKQCVVIMKSLRTVLAEGCPFGADVGRSAQ